MKAKDLRKKFLKFFEEKGHAVIKSSSLVPENDPTTLFITAGMHPLVPFLMGEPHPAGSKLVGVQKCVRTGDIDEVGDEVHLTFFEMLGNWSLGEYFKQDAINYSFEFLTGEQWLNLPMSKLAVSVFAGDADAPFDEEAYSIWNGLGFPAPRIAKLGKKDNWWGPAGQSGPCGPDTEMFYWTGESEAPETFDPENNLWVEIWNDVFMEYNKTLDGKFEPLAKKNVDTGMGLERVTAILQGKAGCYETEQFAPLFEKLSEISGKAVDIHSRVQRIIVEHLRAATFMMGDGVVPANMDQGYVLRRLIRRAVNFARKLDLTKPFACELAEVVIAEYGEFHSELVRNREQILLELKAEEEQFARTLETGLKKFHKLVSSIPEHLTNKKISGKNAFHLYDTYGFPLELTTELAKELNIEVDVKGFEKSFKKHQELSRKGAEQKFKGGLADDSVQTSRLHTATHLLHQALKNVLGDHVQQKGSNITADRLRFDFSHPAKMTPEEKAEVERIVNEQIAMNKTIGCADMTVEQATGKGAIGLFGDRYGELVHVYSMGDFSMEICGGPHAAATGELGVFKIKKEESSSRGVRRIKAVLLSKDN